MDSSGEQVGLIDPRESRTGATAGFESQVHYQVRRRVMDVTATNVKELSQDLVHVHKIKDEEGKTVYRVEVAGNPVAYFVSETLAEQEQAKLFLVVTETVLELLRRNREVGRMAPA